MLKSTRVILNDVKDTITYLKSVDHLLIHPTEKRHHNKRHSSWRLTALWLECPMCNLGVRCVIVNWMSDEWFRCINCLLKLPISNDNKRIMNYVFPKLKHKSAIDQNQTILI